MPKKWETVELRQIADARGNLTPIEGGIDIPFEIRRVYYIYDVPGGSTRAGHAHISLHQIYIALSGSFEVLLDDGNTRERITLTLPSRGLHIRPGVWREISSFSSGATCLTLASDHFSESDYVRDYADFRRRYGHQGSIRYGE